MTTQTAETDNKKFGLPLRLAIFYLGPALIFAAIALPDVLFPDQIQRITSSNDRYFNYLSLISAFLPTFFAIWMVDIFPSYIAPKLLIFPRIFPSISKALAESENRRNWATGNIPVVYAFGIFFLANIYIPIVLNVNHYYIQGPLSWFVLLVLTSVLTAGICIPTIATLNRRVAAHERANSNKSKSRQLWLSEVRAGRKLWIWHSILPLFSILLGWIIISNNAYLHTIVSDYWVQALNLLVIVLLLATFAALFTVSDALLAITPDEIRVRFGPFGSFTREFALEKTKSVEVTKAKIFSRRRIRATLLGGNSDIVLRDGPALFIHTLDGKSTLISTPDAAEAAEVLRGWLTDKQPLNSASVP